MSESKKEPYILPGAPGTNWAEQPNVASWVCQNLPNEKEYAALKGELEEDKLAMTDTLQTVLKRRWKTRDKSVSWVFSKNGKQYTKDQLKHVMRNLCKRARVKRFGFHAIRHHVAAILRDSGKATLGQIQKFLRHHRATTTDNYLKGLSPDLIEVAEVLDNVRGQNGRASANRRA